jgi:hypothetical protein
MGGNEIGVFVSPILEIPNYLPNDICYGVNTDLNNNVYTCGTFNDLSFNIYDASDQLVRTLTNITDVSNNANAFLAKYDEYGNFQWAAKMGNENPFESDSALYNIYAYGVVTDKYNNVYTSVKFDQQYIINIYDANDNLVYSVPEGIGANLGIIKYNSEGIFQWVAFMGNTFNIFSSNFDYSVCVDQSNNIYSTGSFTDASFNIYSSNGQLSTTLINTDLSYNTNVFVVKYDSNGYFNWAAQMNYNSSVDQTFGGDEGISISTDTNNNVYVSGYFTGDSLNIYNAQNQLSKTLTNVSTSPTNYNGFIVKYDSVGNFIWAGQFGGDANQSAYSNSTDVNDFIYVTGRFVSPVMNIYDANGNISATLTNTTSPNSNGFTVKYDANGNVIWALNAQNSNTTVSGARTRAVACSKYALSTPIICFKEDSKILCLINDVETYVPIQDIRKGTLVKTYSSGYVPVNMIGTSKIYNEANDLRGKNRLYKCSPEKYPELTEDLIITGCHSILVGYLTDEQRAKTKEILERIFATENHYRLIAMIDERAEPYQEEGVFSIWHLALDHEDECMNYGVYANGGLLVETTSKRMLSLYSGMTLLK